jgi:hypothetical protein
MLKNFAPAGLFPHSETAQWRPHEACTEPSEVKTVSEFGDLAIQVIFH